MVTLGITAGLGQGLLLKYLEFSCMWAIGPSA